MQAQDRTLGNLAEQVVNSSKTNLRQKASQTELVANQILAHARHALDPHTSLLSVSARIVAEEPARIVQAQHRLLGTLSRQVAISRMTNIRQASSQRESTAQQILAHARRALGPHIAVLNGSARVVSEEPARVMKSQDRILDDLVERISTGFAVVLRAEERRLRNLEDLVTAHDPESVLRRGFSITLDESGRAIKDAALVEIGATIVTKLGRGQVQSTVTKKE